MKRIYSNQNAALAWHIHNLLQQQGVDTEIRNDKLYSVAGELPPAECMAEVWVRNPLHYDRAERLVREAENLDEQDVDAEDWTCRHCGETNAGNFDICWNCQSSYSEAD